jgi:RNase H-like domain found in reverse transcriptase
MDPFDQEGANKDSKDRVNWTPQLAHAFAKAKNAIDTVKELYLPSPQDQLLMVPDGSQKTPGIGHVLYALVDGVRKPVRFHSVKLPENCKKWAPCEIEALAFATGIQAEIDIIKESQKPLLISASSDAWFYCLPSSCTCRYHSAT